VTLRRALAAALAAFVLLEASARLALFGPAGLDPRRVGLLRDTPPTALVTYDTDPALVWEYRPGLDVFFKLVRFRTNSRGMRDREYPLAKPPDTVRVAVLGSSFALPAGVEIEDAFHSLLEERLGRELAPARFEFLNFAVGMYGPAQCLAMLRLRALAYDPDLILLSVSPLAAPRLLGRSDAVPPRDALRLVPSGPRSWLLRLAAARIGLGASAFGAPPVPERAPAGQDVITKLGEAARAAAIPVVVARLEVDARAPSDVEREVEDRVRREGMLWVDTRGAFQGQDPRSFWIYALDPHPNARAHAVFADVLHEALRAYGLLERRPAPAGVSGSRTRTEPLAASP
jgi:hypothetical protein